MTKTNKTAAALFLLLTVLSCMPLFAKGSSKDSKNNSGFYIWGKKEVFALDPVTDGILLGTGLTLTKTELLLDKVFKVNRQKYNGARFNKADVPGFERPFMNQYSLVLDYTGDFLMFTAMVTPTVLFATEKSEWLTCAAMYAETVLIANGITELAKIGINRTRPFMYFDEDTYPDKDVKSGDWAKSMPSRHSTMAFAGAAFTTYTFCKYFPDSNWRIPVVAGSYSLALLTAAFRVASGNHFITDTLTGAAIGTAVGFLVPWLHTFNTTHDVNVSLQADGFAVAVKF